MARIFTRFMQEVRAIPSKRSPQKRTMTPRIGGRYASRLTKRIETSAEVPRMQTC
jgi:hypothetical protein